MIIKICIECEKKFKTNYKQKKFCSKTCRYTPCLVCSELIDNPRRDRKTCSRKCKGLYQKHQFLGKNNPNYGKKWSEDKKRKQSEIIKSKVDDEYRFKAGSANKGKKFSKEKIERMHGHRTFESYSRPLSEKTKEKIGKKSKEKFTKEFKQRHRQTMEKKGYWIPLNKKTDYEIYFKESDWIKPMFDELYDKNKLLIETHGIFNAFDNSRGVVRDHMFSRRSGFELGVFPEILRHIENCQIILHSDNVKKNVSKSINSDSLTIKELLDKIENTVHTNWEEQEICLAKIEDYKNGKRWKRKEAK